MDIYNLLRPRCVEIPNLLSRGSIERGFKVVGECGLGLLELVGDAILGVVGFSCFSGAEFGVEGLEKRGEAGCDSGFLVEFDTYKWGKGGRGM